MTESYKFYYDGNTDSIEPCDASIELVNETNRLLEGRFGSNFRTIHTQLTNNEFLYELSLVRSELNCSVIQNIAWEILQTRGHDLSLLAVDQVRLRAVVPDAHHISAASPAYGAHRDTWYANPQSQINCWIPLHGIAEDEGFDIYPNYLSEAVSNGSDKFNYNLFKESIGWQSRKTDSKFYPVLLSDINLDIVKPVFGGKASMSFFSAAHLHQTKKISGNKIRFSLDFRFVNVEDEINGKGAPNVDNYSKGSAMEDYLRYK